MSTTNFFNKLSENLELNIKSQAIAGMITLAVVFIVVVIAMFFNPVKVYSTAKVGVLLAQSGLAENAGKATLRGIDLAHLQKDMTNIELIVEDSQCDPSVAPGAAQRLIDQGVVAIIGDTCSTSSLSVLSVVNAAKIPLISPSSSSPRLSIANDYFFRVVPTDDYQGSFMAREMRSRGLSRAGVFFTNEAYGSALANIFTDEFTSAGGEVVYSAYAESEEVDLVTQVDNFIASEPDLVVIFSNSSDNTVAFAQQLRAKGFTGQLAGGDAIYQGAMLTLAPAESEGMYVTIFATGDEEFIQSVVGEEGSVDQIYAVSQGYDALDTIYRIVEEGYRDNGDFYNALINTDFDGVSGRIRFDGNGDLPGIDYKYGLVQVVNGRFVIVND